MRPTGFQVALYLAVALPPALIGLLGISWWSSLRRPWVFVAAGLASLYALAALMVIALILIGPGFRGYFLEAPKTGVVAAASFPAIEMTSVVVFLGISAAALWGLKQWLLRP